MVDEPDGLSVVTPLVVDVAQGLVSHHDHGTAWVVLSLNLIDLIELEHAGERLLDALWSAAAEEPIAPAVLDGAQALARR